MARRAIQLAWADGEYAFKLTFAGLGELQEITGYGPARLMDRLSRNEWTARELREIIRIGLMGGGMDMAGSRTLVQRYIEDGGGLLEHVPVAQSILLNVLVGAPDEPVPEKKADGTEAPTDQTPTG